LYTLILVRSIQFLFLLRVRAKAESPQERALIFVIMASDQRKLVL